MKNILKGIFIVLIALIIFNCREKERVFVIGTNAEYPPFEYLENGKVVGLDSDIIEVIFQKLGYQYKWANMVHFKSPYLTLKGAFITNKKNGVELGTTKKNTAKNILGSTVIPFQNNTLDLLLVGILEGEPKAIALGKNDKDYKKINEALIQ